MGHLLNLNHLLHLYHLLNLYHLLHLLKMKKTKIRSYAEDVSSRVAQNSSNNRYSAKTDNNNGISSRYLANSNIFLKRKNYVEVEVGKLLSSSKNNQIQPSTLKLRATDLKSKLTSLKIDKWVEGDKLGQFDPIDLCNWEDRMDRDIASVLYQTEDLINVRKGLAQSGIKKRDPPKFSGSVLDYPLLKKNWSIEVSPGGLPELIELNLLKDSVPLTAKDRLYEVENMVEAWDILNKIYGKHFDLRSRLKQEFLAIKISQKFSPLVELEIFQKVHKIASRIKAAKAQSLLENDFEYISLVYQLLSEIQREKWVSLAGSNPTWDSFYKFLEDMYERALLKKQINDSCKQNMSKDKPTCTKCNRVGHTAEKCFSKNVVATTVGQSNCPVCGDSLHSIQTKDNNSIISRRVYNCPKFKEADSNTKKQYITNVKNKFKKLCNICYGWTHEVSDCRYNKVVCSKCNGNHFYDTCDLQQFVSCASFGSSMSKLCVQDIPVSVDSKFDKNARVLFDNGSQTTLVRDHFAEQAGWSYTKAQYTLAGIGNKSRLIQGKLWNVTLKDREGKMHVIQGYGVPSILQENWYFPAIKDVAGKFPNVPKEVFLAQESRPLDILIGTDSLNLMPKCNYGSDCKNCEDGLCW